jgi:putative OmpL-like beta-barrel porin-2
VVTMRASLAGRRVRSVLAGAVAVLMCAAGPAMAQGPSGAGDPQAPPAGGEAQTPPPAPTPEEIAAKQDSTTMDFFRRTEVSGFVDTYYEYNFNKPTKPCATIGGVAVFNCLRNFDIAHNSFSLNLAEVAFEKKPTADSRGGFRIDLDYGPTAHIVNAFEPSGASSLANVEQAYVSYLAPTGTGLQLDFGKFVTPMGNEVIESKDNWNYSRSLLFALAIPYYHMGMRVSYSPNDKVALQGFLVNGWNNVQDNNKGKTVGGSVTLKPTAAVAIIENYLTGQEQGNLIDSGPWRNTSDTVVTYTANKQVSLAVNYDYGRDKFPTVANSLTNVTWQGVAFNVKYQANDWFALTPRVEYYDDKDGFTTGVGQKLKEATVTAEFKHKDGFIMRLEYRGDFSDQPFFPKNTTGTAKSQNTVTFGFIYAFTTKAS